MFEIPHLRQWHWPHLGLLVLLPLLATVSITSGLDHRWILFVWLLINVLVLAAAEYARPYRTDWRPDAIRVKRDAGLWSVNLLTDAAIGALLAAMMLTLTLDITSLTLTLTWQIAIGLLLAELGSYWLHRLSHADGWLWRVHLLHHRPNQVNVANALTLHPINMIYNKLARLLPLLVLGLSADAILVVAMFELTQALVTHANIAGRMGPLNLIVGSAELHRLHHSTEATDAGNFGTSLPIWDQLFGTYRASEQVQRRCGPWMARPESSTQVLDSGAMSPDTCRTHCGSESPGWTYSDPPYRAGSAPKSVGVFDQQAYPGELEICTLLNWPFSAKRVTCSWQAWRCCHAPT